MTLRWHINTKFLVKICYIYIHITCLASRIFLWLGFLNYLSCWATAFHYYHNHFFSFYYSYKRFCCRIFKRGVSKTHKKFFKVWVIWEVFFNLVKSENSRIAENKNYKNYIAFWILFCGLLEEENYFLTKQLQQSSVFSGII